MQPFSSPFHCRRLEKTLGSDFLKLSRSTNVDREFLISFSLTQLRCSDIKDASLSLSVWLTSCVYVSVSLCLSPFVSPIYLSLCLSSSALCIAVFLMLSPLSISISLSPSICLSVYLPACLSLSLSPSSPLSSTLSHIGFTFCFSFSSAIV